LIDFRGSIRYSATERAPSVSDRQGSQLIYLIVPAVVANIGYVILSKQDDRGYQARTDNWIDEVRELVGDDDLNSTFEQDPHFADYGTDERELILRALRRQPRSRRSLNSASIETGLDVR